MVAAPSTDSTTTVLVFQLGSGRFALPAACVRQIVRAVAIAPLPKAPTMVEGVINCRGAIVPVLDIRHRFGLAPTALHPSQHLVIAQAGSRTVALRVDRAAAVTHLSADAIEPPDRITPGLEHVLGIARQADGLVVIQDLEQFLSVDEADQLDAAMAKRSRRPPAP